MNAPAALAQATFPEPVLEILRRLAGAGHRSWLVGGAVRDLLLHRQRTATDFDVYLGLAYAMRDAQAALASAGTTA